MKNGYNNIVLSFLFAALLMLNNNVSFGQNLILVKNHKPKSVIIISESASDQIKSAANYLQTSIQKSTGALIPIVSKELDAVTQIHVGYTSYVNELNIERGKIDDDGFLFRKVDNQNFIIVGGSDWGTEFGIYTFIEKYLDAQFLMPTDIGFNYSKKAGIQIPETNIIENPVYLSRQLSPLNINTDNDIGRWARFNKARGRILFHHNLLNLYDPSEFKKSNPDFFNNANLATKERWQPNFSAKGIADSGASKIIKYFKANPDVTSYSLGINDSRDFDQSKESLRRRSGRKNYLGLEDVSDDYFRWANDIAKKVTKIFPDKLFGLLAYNNVAEPPSPSVGINPAIIPFITYERMRWADTTLRKKGHELSEAWTKEAETIGWYDYAYGLNYMTPRVWFHEMQQYLQWGASHHVKYYYAELYPNWGEGPKPWVLTKLLWNPDYDVDSLLNVWYVKTAGTKAAPYLKSYYEIWEKFWTKDIYTSKWITGKGQYLEFTNYAYLDAVPQEYIDRSEILMQNALKYTCKGDAKKRVEKLSNMWSIYRTAIELYQRAPVNQKNNILKTSPSFIALLNKYEKDPILGNSVESIKHYMNLDK